MHIRQLSPRSMKKMENNMSLLEPREYKVVLIGDEGVGKTGKYLQHAKPSYHFDTLNHPTILTKILSITSD